MSQGTANVRLFKILYWIFALVFVAFGFGNVPLSKQLTPGFPENMVIGQICLKKELIYSKDSVKARLIGFAFPILHMICDSHLRGQVFRYVHGQCLNKKTFSAFGGIFRRNIFTYKQTFWSNLCWPCRFIILENAMLIGLEVYSKHLNVNLSCALHNLFCVFFIDIFHGLYLPLKYLHSSKDHFSSERKAEKRKKNFYIRSPDIAPRRDCASKSIDSHPALLDQYSELDPLKTPSTINQWDSEPVPVEM